jgi:hypothetical protein
MQFNGRGFYNTLVFSSSGSQEPWQVDDYSKYLLETLFSKLAHLGITLDKSSFLEFASQADSPEDLTEILCPQDEDHPDYAKAYLLIFELWIRLCPQKESLSVFCDRLDHFIHRYDEDENVADELVRALTDLLKIFENLQDSGLSQKETYDLFSSYLAQDLETFIYDFLCDLIEAGEKSLAFEFIFGFYNFLHDKPALDVLKATINLIENPDDSEVVFLNIMEKIFEKKRHNLVLDAVYFTYDNGFRQISKDIASKLILITHGDEKVEVLALLEPLRKDLNL